jgi:hypothetical protein
MTDAPSVNTIVPASIPAWHEKIDINNATGRQFAELVAEFNEWAKDQPDDPKPLLPLTDGWHTITPEIALHLLIRNASNRKPTLGNVAYFADMMKGGDWPETGQAIILTPNKRMDDGQHRAWASLLSSTAFPTYVVNQRASIPNSFCYIDNGKVRSAKDALETAGFNGLSPTIVQVVSMAMHYEENAYKPDSVQRLPKISPLKVLDYVQQHPNIRAAVRLMAGEYSAALAVIDHKDVAGFTAYMILSLHDEAVLADFMNDLGAVNEQFDAGSPVAALQAVLRADQVTDEPMKKHQLLGHIIKGFNSYVAREQVKRIGLRVNEPYPRFDAKAGVEAEEPAVAAE